MATAPTGILLRHLRGLTAARAAEGLLDGQLLERFTRGHEDAAFAALVRRHGPLVLGVCRRVLHDMHDAEDAFQATFLVLAQKARSIAKRESLGSWLYKVAYRVAVRARGQEAARHIREKQASAKPSPDPLAEITGRELLTALDGELQQLPERYRAPLVLHYLQGEAHHLVARRLGWSLRTLRRRLAQGRECLRARLERRHLGLPAALLLAGLGAGAKAAPVPAPLAAATVRTAARALTDSAGEVTASAVAELAAGTLGAMRASKLPWLAAVLLAAACSAAAGWLVYQGGRLPAAAAAEAHPPAQAQKLPAAAAKRPARPGKPDERPSMTLTGRVLDAAGKPLAGTRVTVLSRLGVRLSSWENWAWHRTEVLGRASAGKDGRYRLTVPATAVVPCRQVRVVAASPGHGLGWQWVDPAARTATADIRLTPQQIVRGRLVDLQGQPAAGVKVRVAAVTRKAIRGRGGDYLPVPAGGLPGGIEAAATDARGYFTLAGFGPGLKLELHLRAERFANQDDIEIDSDVKKQAENFRLVLLPPRVVNGRVTYADTGKPVAGAAVEVYTWGAGTASGKTDPAGRYLLHTQPESKLGRQFNTRLVAVTVRPPRGEPYLIAHKGFQWPQGAVLRQTVDLALARGVVVRGKVTEARSGRPVARAFVGYNDKWAERVAAGSDGTYRIVIPPGKGQLQITCPTPDYIPEVLGSAGGVPGKPVGDPVYYHAVVELDVKLAEGKREVPVTVHRGVTVKGRLVGPDGKRVKSAVIFVAAHRPPYEKTMSPIYVTGGRFEIPGCDPANTYRLTFLEHPHAVGLVMGVESVKGSGQLWLRELLGNKGRLGAVAHISAAEAARKPVTVRMAPCGSVRLRFRDAAGKPVAKYTPWLQLVVTPGPTIYEALERKTLAAEVVTLAGRYAEPTDPHTDAKGFLTYDGLIPGAIYRVKKTRQEPRNEVLKDFTAQPGKTTEVDVVVK
jgi:RNA polymerase sigma factor (sigma-70 family)